MGNSLREQVTNIFSMAEVCTFTSVLLSLFSLVSAFEVRPRDDRPRVLVIVFMLRPFKVTTTSAQV